MVSFQIEKENFSGPIELLLSMIEKRKLPISQISLADVTDEYLKFIRGNEDKNINDITYFLNIAATLILIKSKSLLPALEYTKDEEKDIKDLENRLARLKLFQNLGQKLEKRFFAKRKNYFSKPRKKEIKFTPDEQIKKENILEIIKEIIDDIPKPVKLEERKIKKVIDLDIVLKDLELRIKDAMNKSFFDFVGRGENSAKSEKKEFTVVGFLALLELIRGGLANVVQSSHDEDIQIEKV